MKRKILAFMLSALLLLGAMPGMAPAGGTSEAWCAEANIPFFAE